MTALAALILILFLFRPGVYRLRNRIGWSIGAAIGRRVTIDNVRVHVLPRPGFDLEGLVIYDDPQFSSEPMVRAQEVSAAIRLRSLLRGHLEIANLSATEPSINLVRNEQGLWNLASLLERSAQLPTAPTSSQASGNRLSFPYLEATHARINFKLGQEKKSWALADADVALWQDSDNTWGARLAAQPTRTDLNLSDMGIVHVNATWQRAPTSADTPLQIAVEWRKGQLGQVTKFFSGRDRGWRGDITLQTNLSGSLKALQIQNQLQIDNFRRYDIMGGGQRLFTSCSGRYSVSERSLDDLACESRVGAGSVRVRGRASFSNLATGYDLTLAMEKVPLSSALALLRQAKKGLPDDLQATGRIDGQFRAMRPSSGKVQVTGKGAISGVGLSANNGRDQITAAEIPLILNAGTAKRSRDNGMATLVGGEPSDAHLSVGPFPMAAGSGAPLTAGGWLTPTAYRFFLRGKTEIRSLYRVANATGMHGFRPVAEGFTSLDIAVAGPWQGFAAPVISGTAQLQNVRTGMRGLNPPIEIASAAMKLDPDRVVLQQISAKVGETRWSGSVIAPRNCVSENCFFHFDLSASQLTSTILAEWFTPKPAKRPWYAILGSKVTPGKSPLLAIRANGQIRVGRVVIKGVDGTQVTAQAVLDRGKIGLTNVGARVLQGTYQGRCVIDASAAPPRYQWSGTLQAVSLAALSVAMHDDWVTGTGDARFDLASSGASGADLLAHIDGDVKFMIQNGTLVHLDLPEAPKPFPVHAFAARIQVKNGTWNMKAGRIESRDGIYQISGTASAATGLNLVLTRGDDQSWNVTGTLVKPQLTHVARTEAKSVIK